MGQSKISLKELASVRRKTPESIDDYLNRFRLLKARCFTQVPEHELVEMAAGGLDYSIRKKLDTQHLRDMAQLADRVRQVERLKAEKARSSKDLVQKALKDGRLKFGEKPKQQMKIDEDPLQISDASYVEPVECLMIDAMDLSGGAQLVSIPENEYYEKMKVVYPGAEEELIDFLQRCKLNKSEVMLCPRCSAVFDKKATEGLNKFIP
ncbi:hypothetical protein L195_g051249, partial [Trifolium pratense]